MNAVAGSQVAGGPCSAPVRRITGLSGVLPALVVCGGLLIGAGPGAAQDTTETRPEPAATFQDGALVVESWPSVALRVPAPFEYLGSSAFALYDVSRAETHVFAQVGPDSIVDRLYWFQVEAVRPESDHRYDYSDLPHRVMIGDRSYRADARVGPGYSLDSVDPEGDTAEVLRLLRRRGLVMPHEMVRVRMVAVDETERRELLILYVEALSTLDLSIDRIERSPELLDDVTAAAIARAARGIRIQ